MAQQGTSMLGNRDDCPIDQLGWYANGTLSPRERADVETHLARCAGCRADVEAWSVLRSTLGGVSARAPEPRPDLFAAVERQLDLLPAAPAGQAASAPIHSSRWQGGALDEHRVLRIGRACVLALCVCAEHLRVQARLIRRDLFWLPLLVVPLAVWIIYALPSDRQASASGALPSTVSETAALLAALLTSLGMAFLYGREVDPAHEMVLATSTPPSLVLGVRCSLVFGYDLILNCGVVLPLLAWQGTVTPGWFLTNWLAPLCCLSAITLLLSIAINPATAVVVSVLLWAVRFLDSMQIFEHVPWQRYYEAFWRQGPMLFVIALLALLLAFGLLERKEQFA